MKRRRWNDKGFTLIELFVVSMIMVIISLAIYSTFNNGIKIWQRAKESIAEEDLNIFFDKFSNDLRSTFKFEGSPLLGQADKVEFVTLVESPRLGNRTIGKVIYFYDSTAKILKKEERDFSHVYGDQEGPVKHALKNIKSFKLLYYFYDEEKKEYFWVEDWEEGLPLAVRMILEFDDGKKIFEFTKTVNIPISGF
jgi:prepilin-type N-terminal cleavage/methylation domain-containing protein